MNKYEDKDIINNFKEIFKQEGPALDIKCCWHYGTNPNLGNPNSHSELLISTVAFASLDIIKDDGRCCSYLCYFSKVAYWIFFTTDNKYTV